MPKAKTIKPSEWYSMQDIVRGQMFPWCKSLWSIRNTVALDMRGKNLLKTTVQGTGRSTKYHFKGENIIKFTKAVEAGKVRL